MWPRDRIYFWLLLLTVVLTLSTCTTDDTVVDPVGKLTIKELELINDKIQSELHELLATSFFRYYKINLYRPCPFWKEDLVCNSQGCSIDVLPKDPNGWETKLSDIHFPTFQLAGSIFRAWEQDDDDFCLLDNEGETGVYVDLIENPERFTGYSGPSANRIWASIYEENCFVQERADEPGKSLWHKCEERLLFYNVVSGLHASISVHLADEYFNQRTSQWESNLDLFMERVGQFPDRIVNLFLLYHLIYKAVYCLSSKLDDLPLYKGSNDDMENKQIKTLLTTIANNAPSHWKVGESLFEKTSAMVMEEFKDHFRNVTRIMDCISCERCRLWGKIQTTGVGTALKILSLWEDPKKWLMADFRRSEVIALINTFGRLSESVLAIKNFRHRHASTTHSHWSPSTWQIVGAITISTLTALLLLRKIVFY